MDNNSAEEKWKQVGTYFYDENHPLGEGASGKVFKAYDESNDCKEVALKVIPMEKIQIYEVLFMREIALLKSIQGRHVVEFVNTFRTDQHLYIALEYCDGGSLEKQIEKRREKKQKYSEEEALVIIKQIAIAFAELNTLKGNQGEQVIVMHRDIKPANILFHKGIVKIADFGLAKAVQEAEKDKLKDHTLAGTPIYMAPQVMHKEKYSAKCDVWSAGVMLYELLFYELPWDGHTKENLYKNQRDKPLKFPSKVENETEDLLSKMLTFDDGQRISWEEINNHPAVKYLDVPGEDDEEAVEEQE